MVSSPCVKKCKLDEERERCVHCRRTLQHIIEWKDYSNDVRETIMENLKMEEINEELGNVPDGD